jgi:hypothetical protein
MTPELPDSAFHTSSYADGRHLTPRTIFATSTELAHLLYIGGQIIGTPHVADDARLRAGIVMSHALSEAAQRYGANLRAELELRERDRQALTAHAASAPAERTHPYPDATGYAPASDDDLSHTAVLTFSPALIEEDPSSREVLDDHH